ncbi:MAG: cytochrome P450 [Alphaproteobacteria bacterium]|nr:cytochrome P450 [Alphaproteobacteria bacterium]
MSFQPDLHAYDFENDPVPTLNRLRAEDPVHWSRHGFWFLTRYDHVSAVLKDPVRFSSAAAGWGDSNPLARGGGDATQSKSEQNLSRSLAHSFNQMDAPDHTRIRALVQSAFSRRAVEERRPRIAQVIDELLNAALAKSRFDLVEDFAFHIPIIVASEIIGIPTTDRDKFREAFASAAALMMPKRSEESWAKALAAGRWIGSYLRETVGARRAAPQDDLISALIEAEADGNRLSEPELMSALSTIYTAAGTTTERLISSGLFILLSHPDQWNAVKRDRALVAPALEELLRFHHPTQSTSTNRRCTVNVELGGKTLKAGDTVRVGLGAANRDPAVFADPDRFDITRRMPVPILSFGTGPHFCFGSALARFEAHLAIEAIVSRAPDIELITRQPVKDPARPDRYREILVKA